MSYPSIEWIHWGDVIDTDNLVSTSRHNWHCVEMRFFPLMTQYLRYMWVYADSQDRFSDSQGVENIVTRFSKLRWFSFVAGVLSPSLCTPVIYWHLSNLCFVVWLQILVMEIPRMFRLSFILSSRKFLSVPCYHLLPTQFTAHQLFWINGTRHKSESMDQIIVQKRSKMRLKVAKTCVQSWAKSRRFAIRISVLRLDDY